ncbi:hypothetical protein FHS19_001391 [Paenibacillus rhizosphaerae]|uniref:YCII-related domain-containing protein n=1 Tax=Paenibacillus rhizosphaerae TaxID=297318 RepID=A0A839TPQ6_9BACL|nr:YciI family protein [Paenibacillus rhizosphaerae]MBB3126737.1 hypothetical protein [Paenibacillus rhizosphaerae]
MKYLCLGYLEPELMDARPQEEINGVMQECKPHLEHLYQSGKVLLDAGLDKVATTLQRKNGKLRILDGPFTESKELIGSAFLIEAEDLDEAARVASLHPAVQVSAGESFGWRIEIRPVHHFESFSPEG